MPEKTKRIEIGPRKNLGGGLLFLLLVLVLYGGLFFYNQTLKTRIQKLDDAFAAFNQSRDKNQEKRIEDVQSKLNQAQVLLDSHSFWSKGLEKVQKLTLSSVKFESLVASLPELKFEFRGSAPNLTAIAKQGANFLADQSVKDVSINQIKILTTGETEFVMKLIFDRDRFLK